MILNILLAITLPAFVVSRINGCNVKSAAEFLKKPAFQFSLKLLDNVAEETEQHFVLSPLMTWLQLAAIAEGASGDTLKEILHVTKMRKSMCHRYTNKNIIDDMIEKSNLNVRISSVLVVDKLLKLRNGFINSIRKIEGIKTFSLYFNEPDKSADIVNSFINSKLESEIDDVIDPSDFKYSALMFLDNSQVNNVWKIPFNPLTTVEKFLNYEKRVLGDVNMMSVVDRFNTTFVPALNSNVLELPCNRDDRVSMLIFLPDDNDLDLLFYLFEQNNVHLEDIYKMFEKVGERIVNVKLPRFKISTTVDNMPEIVYDLGIKRVFYPDLANFKKVSDYKIHVSKMIQTADIEVTEFGVSASVSDAENLVNTNDIVDFIVNKPFAYMLVDRRTDLILFAGMYSIPEMY